MNSTGIRYIGTTDDTTTCDHCGREELASTVVLEFLDAEGNSTGDVVHYGTTCAARALAPRGIRTTAARVRSDAAAATAATLAAGAYAVERLARYSGPDAVELFRDGNRQWGTELRSVEWAERALAESIALWTRQAADAALLRGVAA